MIQIIFVFAMISTALLFYMLGIHAALNRIKAALEEDLFIIEDELKTIDGWTTKMADDIKK